MANIIMGAGDFAREVYEYHRYCNVSVDGFYDEISNKSNIKGIPVYSSLSQIVDIKNKNFIVGTGNPQINNKFLDLILKNNLSLSSPLICDSYVGDGIKIENGTIVCPKSVLTCDIVIGKFCVINISCTIGHDCCLADCVVLSPNVSLSGHTVVQKNNLFGTSAVTIPKISICENNVIAANSVVTKNIIDSGMYAGSPAIRKK